MIKTMILAAAFAGVLAMAAGCNTVEGMGRDIEHAGESIQKL